MSRQMTNEMLLPASENLNFTQHIQEKQLLHLSQTQPVPSFFPYVTTKASET